MAEHPTGRQRFGSILRELGGAFNPRVQAQNIEEELARDRLAQQQEQFEGTARARVDDRIVQELTASLRNMDPNNPLRAEIEQTLQTIGGGAFEGLADIPQTLAKPVARKTIVTDDGIYVFDPAEPDVEKSVILAKKLNPDDDIQIVSVAGVGIFSVNKTKNTATNIETLTPKASTDPFEDGLLINTKTSEVVQGNRDKLSGVITFTGIHKLQNKKVGDPGTQGWIFNPLRGATKVKDVVDLKKTGLPEKGAQLGNLSDLLGRVKRAGRSIAGVRGAVGRVAGGFLSDVFSPQVGKTFNDMIGAATPEEAQAFFLQAKKTIADSIEQITAEQSGRVTDVEREITKEATALTEIMRSAGQVEAALVMLMQLKILGIDRERFENTGNFVLDLDTEQGVLAKIAELKEIGLTRSQIVDTISRMRLTRKLIRQAVR